MPDEYKNLDITVYLFAKLAENLQVEPNDELRHTEEWKRVTEEWKAFLDRGMTDLLRYMVYLVDFMRENDIVWGVGRGSSVASYVLYLIGVHKINSIQFDLDWREFLR